MVVIFIGVDVGLNGAVSILGKKGEVLYAAPLPIKKVVYGNKERGLVDVKQLKASILPIIGGQGQDKDAVHIGIEFIFATPASRSNGLLMSGINYGRIWTTLELISDNVSIIHPRVWHKYAFNKYTDIVNGETDTKLASLAIAKKIYGEDVLKPNKRSKKLHDGVADSLLIAEYVRRSLE